MGNGHHAALDARVLERAEERAELALDLFIDAFQCFCFLFLSPLKKKGGGATPRPYLKASKHCAAHGAKILICISDDLCVRNTLYRLQTCERSECAAAA